MKINFTKMHGLGNDYVYVNGFKENIENPNEFSKFISDRHFGIGSDGLVIILPSKKADFKMRMFNADGSEGKMCGNASRCIGKYVYENGLTDKTNISLETLAGIKYLTLNVTDNIVKSVKVDMGKTIITPHDIPVISDLPKFVNEPIEIDNQTYYVTCVSMGNPHAIIFCDNVDEIDLEKIGPKFESHPLFPDRINTEFVQIINSTTVKMRVWERGSGETLACGTGACATAVACTLNGHFKQGDNIVVMLRGGNLSITYTENQTVFMEGSATKVFDGIIEY